MTKTSGLVACLTVAAGGFAVAEPPAAPNPVADAVGALKARNLGPAIFSGRIADIAVSPENPREWYLAVASGNVWKTTNAGVTFSPIFDSNGSYSIGCVTIDPRNANTIWVGTGENNSQRSVGWGDGVYVSRDRGHSFTNVGLKASEHIGMIRVDPRDSSVVYVAAQGPLWADGGERGLYKTNDGGATWNRVLHISEQTGVSEVHLDPRNPDVMYAVAYQRRRHQWTLINGGPECAIHTSLDAGKTWKKLEGGLPKEGVGRIGMAISPANPDVIYATIEANEKKTRGLWKSTDRGARWEKVNDHVATSPQYYQEVFADPKDEKVVFIADTFLQWSNDGGHTVKGVGEKDKHVDNHIVWIDPNDTNHLLVGCDGGLYESFDRGKEWRHFENLPVMQFYRVAVDNSTPFYYVYGGTQDNATIGGPSRTVDRVGITNEDWFTVTGGDGFEPAIDPTDPSIVYGQSQHAGLVRFDRRSGEEVAIRPISHDPDKPFNFHWDTPLVISPHKPSRLYLACNYLLRSDDRGDSWTRVSEDLTRGIDRNTLKVMGVIQKPDAVAKHMSTSIFGTAVAMDESPKAEGLIYVGMDDGLIHVTEDGGKTWRKHESVAGIPDMTYVSCLKASVHDAATVFACFDNHKMGDFLPYVMRSDDRGLTWRSISGDLPKNCTVYSIVQDHVKADLLFVGTEFGAFATVDGGVHWYKIGGMPTIAVRDVEIQRRESDLVMASFGRGFYVLDDYAALRSIPDETLGKSAAIFPIRPATSYVEKARVGGTTGRGVGGASSYSAPNPPIGATITYFIKDKPATLKEQRKESEKKDDWKYATIEQLQAEDRAAEPTLVMLIRDNAGALIRTLALPREAGVQRVTWNLRFAPSSATKLDKGEKEPWDYDLDGTLVPPGTYSASVALIKDGVTTLLAGPESFEVRDLNLATLAAKDEARGAKFAFERGAAELQRAVDGAAGVLGECRNRLTFLKEAAKNTPGVGAADVSGDVESIRTTLDAIDRDLSGDSTLDKRLVARHLSIRERVSTIIETNLMTTQPPTGTHKQAFELCSREFAGVLARLKSVVEKDVPALEKKLDKAPWTPGRMPTWGSQRP